MSKDRLAGGLDAAGKPDVKSGKEVTSGDTKSISYRLGSCLTFAYSRLCCKKNPAKSVDPALDPAATKPAAADSAATTPGVDNRTSRYPLRLRKAVQRLGF